MDFRRRHARTSHGKPGLLHVVALSSASRATVASRRALDRLRLFELFDHKIAFRCHRLPAQPGAGHFADVLRDARFPLHEHVQIAGIEHEQACPRERGNGRGSARPPQRRDLAEEMTGAEPNALVLELDLHFSGRHEIHGMSGLAALGDNVASLDLLRAQEPHDVGDIRACSSANKGTRATMPQVTTKSRRWTSSAKAVATMPIGRATMINPTKIVTDATMRPSTVTGTTSP